jgi:hypothetical protein
MKRMPLFSVLMVLVFLAGSASFADNHAKAMTDDDVIAMVKAGLPDDTILSAISAQTTDFDLSASALINLKKQDVSVKVIDAMLAAGKHHDAGASSTAAPASGSNPSAAGAPSQREQFVPASSNSPQPANNSQGGAQASGAPAAGGSAAPAQHTSFFDKMSQMENQATGAVQQGQSAYQQMRSAVPGHPSNPAAGQTTGAYPAASAAPAYNTTPAANPPAANRPAANGAAANQAAAQARLQQQQRDYAARRAAAQQQRQQQAAANQQRSAQINACMQQARKTYPKGGPDLSNALRACVQAK